MIYQFILIILIGVFFSFFFNSTLYLSAGFHEACLALAPSSAYSSLYQAIVCGMKLPPGKEFYLLKNAGILHIIVVSGAHLVFLSNVIQFFYKGRHCEKIQIGLLFFFVAICELQMPALRAWLFLVIQSTDKKLKLFNPPAFSILLSVTLCLAIHPPSFYSLSLPMSWSACLGIYLGRNTFTQSLLCYGFLTPIFAQFASFSIWTIAINAFLTPLICVFLFPLSLITMLVHPLHRLVDFIWQNLLWLCSLLNLQMGVGIQLDFYLDTLFIWLIPTAINFALIVMEKRNRNG